MEKKDEKEIKVMSFYDFRARLPCVPSMGLKDASHGDKVTESKHYIIVSCPIFPCIGTDSEFF